MPKAKRTMLHRSGIFIRLYGDQISSYLEEEKHFSEYRDYVENNMPETSVVDLPAGHAVNMECPDLFNDVIKEFLQQHIWIRM